MPFLTARWTDLVMLNWVVDPTILAARVPSGTELDQFSGRTYLSVVGFWFGEARVMGLPIPFHRHFPEVNLRFYVRRKVGSEVRRGVVFVKELVPRRCIAAVARAVYGENYHALPMARSAVADRLEYSWRRAGRWESVGATRVGQPEPLAVGSEAEFIAEHYWGYCRRRDGRTVEYRVEHPRWRAWAARDARLVADVAGLYGDEFAGVLGAPPSSALIAEGSGVEVR